MTLVASACLLSLIFVGEIEGVREGTLAAALLVGTLTRRLRRPMARAEVWFTRGLGGQEEERPTV